MSLIQVSGLTFCYEGSYDNIFENASFQIDTAWRLGFTGRNGRGKTTFFNLLMGKYEYQGKITAAVDFEYFPYEVEDMSEFTISIVEQVAPEAQLWQIMRELNRLEVEEDVLYRPFETLSNGERTKVLLAAMFLRENSFLLIDEPTNHLDIAARRLLTEYLRTKSGFILVSHDRALLDGCVDHILSINRATIEVQNGNFSSWYYNKQLKDNYETEQNERLKKDIKRLTETAKEKAAWSDRVEATKSGKGVADKVNNRGHIGHMAAKAMKRSKSIETRMEREIGEKEQLLKDVEKKEQLKLHPLVFHSKRLTEFRDVSLYYGEKQVCGGLSFTVERGDRIALCGKNGCGKSSIIKLICGEAEETLRSEGDIYIAKGLKISYVNQDTSTLSGKIEDYEQASGVDPSLFRTILRKLDFSRIQFEKDLKELSAGQKKKIVLARSLSEEAHLYVWDEPLNYIDVLSRMQIEELLTQYAPTLLFVEHDSSFCDNVANRTVRIG
ncbi:MAG: ABC-F type ribosomal protection protein [Ruminococcaceae bacterium]|nr:ABC-F type ribosomal protection protein [Oscillospiraceae bacterium]